jgi:hypothetical protein
VTIHDDNIPVIDDRGHSETPRDRQGAFEPQIVRKHWRRFDGFDDKIVALYAREMSVRDIHPEEIYGVRVGHDLISRVTDAVLEDVRSWQSRPFVSRPKPPGRTRQSQSRPTWRRSCDVWIPALSAALALFHRCRSEAAADRAPAHDWISSDASVRRLSSATFA